MAGRKEFPGRRRVRPPPRLTKTAPSLADGGELCQSSPGIFIQEPQGVEGPFLPNFRGRDAPEPKPAAHLSRVLAPFLHPAKKHRANKNFSALPPLPKRISITAKAPEKP